MLVNVNPEPASLGETLCSLRFAAKVNQCETGARGGARRHVSQLPGAKVRQERRQSSHAQGSGLRVFGLNASAGVAASGSQPRALSAGVWSLQHMHADRMEPWHACSPGCVPAGHGRQDRAGAGRQAQGASNCWAPFWFASGQGRLSLPDWQAQYKQQMLQPSLP